MTDPEAPTYANTIKLELLIADLQAKLAAVEQERDTMRTALLAAKDALEGYAACCDGCTCGDGWGHEAAQAALLRLAQAMRGR